MVSLGHTRAEKTLAESYAEGHVVAFHRVYKRLGAGKGDEFRVAGTNPKTGTVVFEKANGSTVAWQPHRLAGNSGGNVSDLFSLRLDATKRIYGIRDSLLPMKSSTK